MTEFTQATARNLQAYGAYTVCVLMSDRAATSGFKAVKLRKLAAAEKRK